MRLQSKKEYQENVDRVHKVQRLEHEVAELTAARENHRVLLHAMGYDVKRLETIIHWEIMHWKWGQRLAMNDDTLREVDRLRLIKDAYQRYLNEQTQEEPDMDENFKPEHPENIAHQSLNTEDDAIYPAHYRAGGVDVIEYAGHHMPREHLIGFHRINTLKYLTRYDKKHGVEDLKKARFYLDKLIALEEVPF